MADNKVEIIVSLRDQATAALQQLANRVAETSASMQRNFRDAADYSEKLALGLGGAATAMGLLGKTALDQAAQLEQTQVSFTTMLGSAEAAGSFIKELAAFAARTPFELKGLEQASKQLLAYGFTQKEVLPNLKALGDIASGVGMEKLPNLILAFGQVKAKTKLMGDELRQFTEAGVPLLDMLAQQMKKPVSAIQDMVTKGQIGFPAVQSAMKALTEEGGRFNNLMDKQSKTFSGMVSNLSDAWTQFLRGAGQPLLEWGKQIVDWLTNFVKNDLQGWIDKTGELYEWTQKHQTAMAALAGVLTGLLAPAVIAVVLAVANLIAVMSPWVIAATAVAVAAQQIYEHWTQVKPVLITAATAFGLLATAMAWANREAIFTAGRALATSLFTMTAAAGGATTATTGLAVSIGAATRATMVFLATPLGAALALISAAIIGVTYAVSSVSAEMEALASASQKNADLFKLQSEESAAYAERLSKIAPEVQKIVEAESEMQRGQATLSKLTSEYQTELSSTYNILGGLIGLESERAQKLEVEISTALAKQDENMAKYRETASVADLQYRTIAGARELLKNKEVQLSDEELAHRIEIFKRESSEYLAKASVELDAAQGNAKLLSEINQESSQKLREMLAGELSYRGSITNQQIAILRKFAADEIELHGSVTQLTANQLTARLQLVQQFGISSIESRKALLAYDIAASNDELKIYADKLKKEHEATQRFHDNLELISKDPIIQKFAIDVSTNLQDTGVVGVFKSILLDGLGQGAKEIKKMSSDYQMQVSDIDKSFEKARDHVLATSASMSSGIASSSKSAAKAVDTAAKDAEKASKENADAVLKLQETYKTSTDKIKDDVLKMKETHDKNITSMTDKVKELKASMADLATGYTKDSGDNTKGIAEKYVEEEKKIKELQKQYSEREKEMVDSGTYNNRDATLMDLQAKLKKEQDAMTANADITKDYSKEITEARRRDGMSDYARSVEDFKKKKADLDKEFKEKTDKIAQEIAAIDKKIKDENKLYDVQQERMAAMRLLEAQQYELHMSNLTEITKTSVEGMVTELTKLYEMQQKVGVSKTLTDVAAATDPSRLKTTLEPVKKFATGGIVPGLTLGDSVPALLSPQEEVVTRSDGSTTIGKINELLSALKTQNSRPTINQNITQHIAGNQSVQAAAQEQFFAARTARFF